VDKVKATRTSNPWPPEGESLLCALQRIVPEWWTAFLSAAGITEYADLIEGRANLNDRMQRIWYVLLWRFQRALKTGNFYFMGTVDGVRERIPLELIMEFIRTPNVDWRKGTLTHTVHYEDQTITGLRVHCLVQSKRKDSSDWLRDKWEELHKAGRMPDILSSRVNLTDLAKTFLAGLGNARIYGKISDRELPKLKTVQNWVYTQVRQERIALKQQKRQQVKT
jgi:hypothetical protein